MSLNSHREAILTVMLMSRNWLHISNINLFIDNVFPFDKLFFLFGFGFFVLNSGLLSDNLAKCSWILTQSLIC